MRRRAPPTVALLTDFGTRDVFVGVMKAVIAGMAPSARAIDLTHDVPAGDIRIAAFRLWQSLPFLPPGTVVLAVVDPGVGTSRRALAVSVSDVTIVCPDNGLLTFVLAQAEIGPAGRRPGLPGPVNAFQLTEAPGDDRAVSTTFHGRDVFAPAAARLLAGARPEDLGPAVNALVRLQLPLLSISGSFPAARGEILTSDRFGNLVSSIGILRRQGRALNLEPWLPGCPSVSLQVKDLLVNVGGLPGIPLATTYAEAAPGALLAYVGSDGLLEIGANGGRAADLIGESADVEIVPRS